MCLLGAVHGAEFFEEGVAVMEKIGIQEVQQTEEFLLPRAKRSVPSAHEARNRILAWAESACSVPPELCFSEKSPGEIKLEII